MIDRLIILEGDAVVQLRTLETGSIQCVVTSPPYWGLRDYGDNGQLGLEKTPDEYVAKMVEVFREVRRVLRKDGTLWLNLGDSYAGGGNYRGVNPDTLSEKQGSNRASHGLSQRCGIVDLPPGLKPKDLCGIPWRVAFALQADGWWLRSDIIWAKPNPMPESVTDRPTKSHEYLFLLTKSANYFYDAEAIKENYAQSTLLDKRDPIDALRIDRGFPGQAQRGGHLLCDTRKGIGRNKRSVWTVATAPYPEAHFATYPPDLIKPCIMSGTSAKGCCGKCGAPWERVVEKGEVVSIGGSSDENRPKARIADSGPMERRNADGSSASQFSHQFIHRENKTLGWQPTCKHDASVGIQLCTVLDPFGGSGTTGAVALELGRKAVLIELNPSYCDLIRQRTDVTPGLQLA